MDLDDISFDKFEELRAEWVKLASSSAEGIWCTGKSLSRTGRLLVSIDALWFIQLQLAPTLGRRRGGLAHPFSAGREIHDSR